MDRQKVSCSMKVCGVATTTHSHIRRIEPIDRWIKACGMLLHSCTSASRSSCSVSGGFWRWRTRLPSSSHKCSIGDRSGDNAEQGRTRVWLWSLQQRRARVQASLVVLWCCLRIGPTTGRLAQSPDSRSLPWTIQTFARPAILREVASLVIIRLYGGDVSLPLRGLLFVLLVSRKRITSLE